MNETTKQFEFIKSKFIKKIDLTIFGTHKPNDDIENILFCGLDDEAVENNMDELCRFIKIIDKYDDRYKKNNNLSGNYGLVEVCNTNGTHKPSTKNKQLRSNFLPNMSHNSLGCDFNIFALIYAFRHKNIIDDEVFKILINNITDNHNKNIDNSFDSCNFNDDIFCFCETYEELFDVTNYVCEFVSDYNDNIKFWKALASTIIKCNNLSNELDKLKLLPPMDHFPGGELFQQSLKEALGTGLVKEVLDIKLTKQEHTMLYGDCDSMYD